MHLQPVLSFVEMEEVVVVSVAAALHSLYLFICDTLERSLIQGTLTKKNINCDFKKNGELASHTKNL